MLKSVEGWWDLLLQWKGAAKLGICKIESHIREMKTRKKKVGLSLVTDRGIIWSHKCMGLWVFTFMKTSPCSRPPFHPFQWKITPTKAFLCRYEAHMGILPPLLSLLNQSFILGTE